MIQSRFRTGTVQKIVRIPLIPETAPERIAELLGYGILRDETGRDVFFLASAVTEDEFDALEPGARVRFLEEPGPLARASQVEVAPEVEREDLSLGTPAARFDL